jgi:hypothetical protein
MRQNHPLRLLSVYFFRRDQLRFGDLEIRFLNGAEKAGPITFVAGRAILLDLDQEYITVAVKGNVFDCLRVAAALAFHPEFLAGAAPKMGFA